MWSYSIQHWIYLCQSNSITLIQIHKVSLTLGMSTMTPHTNILAKTIYHIEYCHFPDFWPFQLILLAVYPMSCFQNYCCGANNYTLCTFVDAFQRHYKDSTGNSWLPLVCWNLPPWLNYNIVHPLCSTCCKYAILLLDSVVRLHNADRNFTTF